MSPGPARRFAKPHTRRRVLIGAVAATASLAAPSLASACSQDNATWLESFLDTTCLQTPLTNTTLDPLGGLRLQTNGAPATTSWATDAHFSAGITHETVTFAPVGLGTLAMSGTGAAASLRLPTTLLPLTPDGSSPALSPTASVAGDGDHVDGPSVIKTGAASYVMYYSGLPEDGTAGKIYRATSADGKSWTRAATPNSPVLAGTPGAFDAKGVFGPHVVYDAGAATGKYKMWYSGRGAVFGAIGYATSEDGVTWVKHTGTANPSDPPVPVLDHGQGGSADSFRAADPWVIKDGPVWKMWYTGEDSNLKRVAYATSTDGIAWQKGGSVLSPDGNAGGNYGGGIFAPTVWKDGSTFQMLFVGQKVGTGETKILSASGSDGISWTVGNVSLNTQNGSFHASNFDSPAVFDEGVAGGERFKLYYSGNSVDANGNFHVRIGLSITSSGSGWQGGKFTGSQTGGSVFDIGAAAAEFDARSASGVAVALTGGTGTDRLVGFYSGTRGSDFTPRLGQAKSADGTTWTKVAGPTTGGNGGAVFPLNPGGTNTAQDDSGQLDPDVLLDGSTYNLYFTGIDSGNTLRIFRATADQDATSKQPGGTWTAPTASTLAGDGSGFDSANVSQPSVIKDGSTYVMYYTGNGEIGRVTSSAADFSSPTRGANPVIVKGTTGTFDESGATDPVVALVAAGDYRMIYTATDSAGVRRLAYATSSDGSSWTKQGVVLNPSQAGFAFDERGVRAGGMVVDGPTLHVFTSGVDRAGRERAGHATSSYPTPVSATDGVPNGWATYQLGNAATSNRDWRSITRTSTGTGVELWFSFLQPYSGTGSFGELWSDYYPVAASSPTDTLNLLLTVKGVRWQARLSGPGGNPTLDTVAVEHAPVQFTAAGSAATKNVEPASTLVLTSWGNLKVTTDTFGAGTVGGTVSVRNADTDAELVPAITLNATGDTTQPLVGINAAQNRRLKLVFNLTSSGTGTAKIRSASVSYSAVAATEPAALFVATPTSGSAPLAVAFDASASFAPAGRTITAYNWDFDGDGVVDQATATPAMSHTYLGGTWTAKLTITDSAGAVSKPATVTIAAADATAPTGVSITGPLVLSKPFQLFKPLPLTWSAADAESGIRSYALFYREATIGGAFGTPVFALSTTATGATFALKPGSTYCFKVSATNGVGLVTTGRERCTALPLHSYGLTAKGTWAKRSKAGHYLGRYRTARAKGATLLRSGVAVKRLSIVATRGRGMGTVSVWIGTTKLKTIKLAATTTRKRQVIAVANFTKVRKGTVKVVVESSGKPVIIEGLAVSKM